MTAARRSRDRRIGIASAGLGVGLLVLSIACGANEASVGPAGANDDPAAESTATLDDDLRERVVGRAFSDVLPPADDGTALPMRPVVLDGFDPSRFTEEALADNPLVIGVEKREPFRLAEGADPLDPNSYDWEKDKDGYWVVSYYDLSLEEVDADLLLDALVYPDEYEGEDIQFPDRIRALDGEKVALTGYMIALRWNKDRLSHFMLVRDLKSCCFGQQPEADEWVDVPMVGQGAEYIQYVPVTTRGTFRIIGSSDEAGYAVGAFKIEGDDAYEE